MVGDESGTEIGGGFGRGEFLRSAMNILVPKFAPFWHHFALLFRGNRGRFNLLQPSFDSEIVAAEFAGFQTGQFFAWGSADTNVWQGCAPGMQSSSVV